MRLLMLKLQGLALATFVISAHSQHYGLQEDGSTVTVLSGVSNKTGRPNYSKFDKELQLLLKEIDIAEEEKKPYRAAFKALQQDLITALKEVDILFKTLFKRLHPTGSSYEGLRITHPNEFDMNAILSLPLNNKEDIKVQKSGYAAHMKLRFLQGDPNQYYDQPWFLSRFKENAKKIATHLKKWWTSHYFLDRQKVLQWMQSAVAKAVENVKGNKSLPTWTYVKDIVQKRSGPAVTLEVHGIKGVDFSVDLVPTLPFSIDLLPRGIKGRVKEKSTTKTPSWYLIPKGYSKHAEGTVWRASLWDQEREFINDLEHFKPLVRLLKRLRDVQDWQFIASYFIKTSGMWILEDEKPIFFKQGIGYLLMKGLTNLEAMMQTCKIPFFWEKDHNLLDGVKQSTCSNTANRLKAVIETFIKSLTDPKEDPMRFFNGTST